MMITTTFSPDNNPTTPNFSPIHVRSKNVSFSETRTLPKRRGVSFCPRVYVLGTLHRWDYTAAELRSTWYTMDELKMMKRSCRKLAQELSNTTNNNCGSTDNNNNNNDCFRGLEGRTTTGLLRRKMIKSTARQAVFREQRRQQQFGINDSRQIADAYFGFTEYPQVTAHMVGLHDEKEANSLNNNIIQITTTSTTTSDGYQRRKSMVKYARSDSMRSMRSIVAFTSTKRLLTEAFFKV